jgi:SAM-dependent methyltransferase
MNKLQQIIWTASKKARQKRAEIFRQSFSLDSTTRILDIGSETGENINLVLSGTGVLPENVYIADIDLVAVTEGNKKFGFHPVLLDQAGILPFEDDYFDIVYCSSVIEHVAVSKGDVWEFVLEKNFDQIAWERQKLLAKEIQRVGRQYFVQTPARSFPVESHTWLPFFSVLPHHLQIKLMRQTNKFWIKEAIPDFKLLDEKQMKKLFPDAEIFFEKKFGLVKSIMAIKSLR